MEVSHCIKYLKTGHQAPLNFQKGKKPCPVCVLLRVILAKPQKPKASQTL